jgi:hypothetical protein
VANIRIQPHGSGAEYSADIYQSAWALPFAPFSPFPLVGSCAEQQTVVA